VTTWTTYDAASKAGHPGIGFVLNGDGIVCIDLDHCLDGGTLADWAQRIIARTPPTYVEVSPSGTGLHIWGRGTVVRGRRTPRGEVYGTGRYITVTGRPFRDAPPTLADLAGVIDTI
jgi:primase-polymerase (primpol)-like protein